MEKLLDSEKHKQTHYDVMTRDAYSQPLAEVEEAKSMVNNISLQYRRLKRSDVLEIGEMKHWSQEVKP
jgi:GTP1/Obg family GTP-binding protein